jgi:hypothetical protein
MLKERVIDAAKLALSAGDKKSLTLFVGIVPLKTFKADVSVIYKKDDLKNPEREIFEIWKELGKLRKRRRLRSLKMIAVIKNQLYEFKEETIADRGEIEELKKLLG